MRATRGGNTLCLLHSSVLLLIWEGQPPRGASRAPSAVGRTQRSRINLKNLVCGFVVVENLGNDIYSDSVPNFNEITHNCIIIAEKPKRATHTELQK